MKKDKDRLNPDKELQELWQADWSVEKSKRVLKELNKLSEQGVAPDELKRHINEMTSRANMVRKGFSWLRAGPVLAPVCAVLLLVWLFPNSDKKLSLVVQNQNLDQEYLELAAVLDQFFLDQDFGLEEIDFEAYEI